MLVTKSDKGTSAYFAPNEFEKIEDAENAILNVLNTRKELTGNIWYLLQLMTRINVDVAKFINEKINLSCNTQFTLEAAIKSYLTIISENSKGY